MNKSDLFIFECKGVFGHDLTNIIEISANEV